MTDGDCIIGVHFVAWSGSAECKGATQASLPIEVTQDLSCNATFAKQFTVAITALGANAQVSVTTGVCSALACTADAGSSASFLAPPVAGFRFTGWSGDKVCTGAVNPLAIDSVDSDITCTANYAARLTATGLVGGVPQYLAQPVHGRVQSMLEIDERAACPELLLNLIPGHELSGLPDQRPQDLQRLSLKPHTNSVLVQLA